MSLTYWSRAEHAPESTFCGRMMPFARQHGDQIGESILAAWARVDVLILDDLLDEAAVRRGPEGERWRNALRVLYKARHDQNLTTIMTSNLSLGKIRDTLGADVASRVNAGPVVEVVAERDYRQVWAAQCRVIVRSSG